jgi:membrane-associated PAP2 superfamily phosphatase
VTQRRFWLRHGALPLALFLPLALSILVGTSLVALLKHFSNVDCPDDLWRYGGSRAYAHVFADKPAGVPRGTCFPGGHSSGAFSLFALYFVFRHGSSRGAFLSLVAVMALGAVFAVGQWSRGQHFPSHDAWSAVICWYVALALYAACRRRGLAQ